MEDDLTLLTSKLVQENRMENNLTLLTSKPHARESNGRQPHNTDI
jgi:hypothetical protein